MNLAETHKDTSFSALQKFGKAGAMLLAFVVVAIGPPALGAALWWPASLSIVAFGVIVGLVAGVGRGFSVGAKFAAIFAIAGTLATAVHGGSALLAALLVMAMSLLVAFYATKGLASPMMIAALFVPFIIHAPAQNLSSTGTADSEFSYLLGTFVVLLTSGAYGAFVAARLIKMPAASETPDIPSVSEAALYGILLAVSTGALTFIALRWFPDTLWVWLPMTIYILTKPTLHLDYQMIRDRLVGTVIGTLMAVALVEVVGSQTVLYALGVIFLTVALTLKSEHSPYWVFASALTPAVIFFSNGDTVGAAGQRLSFTVAGVVIALLIGVITNLIVEAARSRSATEGPEVVSVVPDTA